METLINNIIKERNRLDTILATFLDRPYLMYYGKEACDKICLAFLTKLHLISSLQSSHPVEAKVFLSDDIYRTYCLPFMMPIDTITQNALGSLRIRVYWSSSQYQMKEIPFYLTYSDANLIYEGWLQQLRIADEETKQRPTPISRVLRLSNDLRFVIGHPYEPLIERDFLVEAAMQCLGVSLMNTSF